MTEDSNHTKNHDDQMSHYALNMAFWLTAIFMCAELVGGYIPIR
jgi:Co/Zn/Cd efflux system component